MFSRKAVLKQLYTSDKHEDSVLFIDSEEEEEDTLSPPQQKVRTSTPFFSADRNETGIKLNLNLPPKAS